MNDFRRSRAFYQGEVLIQALYHYLHNSSGLTGTEITLLQADTELVQSMLSDLKDEITQGEEMSSGEIL